MDAIVGYSGFVGLNLLNQIEEENISLYNSKNIEGIRGKDFNRVYFSGMPANKWFINQNPEEDTKLVEKYKEIFSTVKCKELILISSIDVFNDHPYGKNRRELEFFMKNNFNSFIFRLSGLFGRGLKKNVIYDLMNNNQIEKINLKSRFQWYNIDNLLRDIEKYIFKNVKAVNLVNEPIETSEIVTLCFPDKVSFCMSSEEKSVFYNVKSSYGYCSSKESVLSDIFNFTRRRRNLLVSNLAFSSDTEDYFKFLRFWSIDGLEIAPTKINNWENLSIDDFQSNFIKNGFKVHSCQSFLYNSGISNIFKEKSKFIGHCEKYIPLLSSVGIKTIVFGSPKQRSVDDSIPLSEQINIFKEVGNICKNNDILFCIEPNSSHYGCNWLTNMNDTLKFVKEVNHTHIKINFDTGNFLMENDIIDLYSIPFEFIGSVQISDRFLKPITDEIFIFKDYIHFLSSTHRTLKISLEMKETGLFEFFKSLKCFYLVNT